MRKLAVALGCALLIPTPALAAPTTIGSSLATAGSQNLPNCTGSFDCVGMTTNNGAPVAVVPFDGVVTTWRVFAGSTSPVKLRVLRPAGNGAYTGIATSNQETTTAGASPDQFSANIYVEKGDVLAIENATDGLLYAPAAANSVSYWQTLTSGASALPDGSTSAPQYTYAAYEAAMNATITEAQADLSIGILESNDPVGVGQDLQYIVGVSNAGPQPAKSVSLSDTLPQGVTPKSATTSAGTCTNGTTVTCDLGTLASGKTETVTITVTPTAAGTISNSASVSTSTSDPQLMNNAQTVTTTVSEQQVQQQKPTVGSVSFTPARFRLGTFLPRSLRAAKKPPVGTTVRYLSAFAKTVTFSFDRLRKGKKPQPAGKLTRAASQNSASPAKSFRFSGRLSAKRRLRPGRYRVTVVAANGAVVSTAVHKTITVLKP